MRVLDLFSGIGGFSLGLERTGGFKTVQFCEIDPFCRRVLAKHWPDVPCHDDVTTMQFHEGMADVVTGGFPCQDISFAGKGAGLGGERSGLWFEMHRVIAETRPRWVVAENVAALRSRGLDQVLGSLAAIGYDAEWHCIPASAVGAPHRRDRIWIIAYPGGEGRREVLRGAHGYEGADEGRPTQNLHVACGDGAGRHVANSHGDDQHGRSGHVQMGRLGLAEEIARHGDATRTQWGIEPDVGRVANGIPQRVDRLRSLGNSIVPQIATLIGQAILTAEQQQAEAA